MSGVYVPSKQIDVARSYIGYHEGYANKNIFSYWQYGSSYNPWCASFVCYCASMAGFRWWIDCTYGYKGDSNVGAMHYHAINHGVWKNKWTNARPGWAIVLTFGIPDQHVEMVLADYGNKILTIGGNTGNKVAYRTRYRSHTVGFVAIDEAGQNGKIILPSQEEEMKLEDIVIGVANIQGGTLVLYRSGKVVAHGTPHRGDLVTTKANITLGKNDATCILPDPYTDGYWIGRRNGAVHPFNAGFHGSFGTPEIKVGNHATELIGLALAGDPDIGYKGVRGDGTKMTPST